MNPGIKYIGIGFLISVGFGAILLMAFFIGGSLPLGSPPVPTSQIVTATQYAGIPVVSTSTLTPTIAPTFMPTDVPTLAGPTPVPEVVLADHIDQTLATYGGEWNIIIRADGDRTIYAHNADQSDHIASIFKVPEAMLFFKMLEMQGVPPSQYTDYLSTKGTGGRTYQQLLRAMLVESEEDATAILYGVITDSNLDVDSVLRSWGVLHTNMSKRHSTPEDIAALYESLYYGKAITPEGRKIMLDLMSAYTPNDDTRLGVIRTLLPLGGMFYDKRGTVTTPRLIIGDAAMYTWSQNGSEKVYVVVVLGYPGNVPVTNVRLAHGIEAIARLFWNYAAPKNP